MKKKIFINISISFVIIALISFFISCAMNPVTGKREFMLLTQGDEAALGKQTDAQVVEMYGMYENQAINNYINGLGQPMAK